MINRLTQLANLIGNLGIVKSFQNRHGSNTASAVAKRYNDEQDLIRNEMGKVENASDEYRQLAALLRESEQEEQKTVTALTYDGESDDFKDSSLKADSAVEKLNSFSSKDSNLATLLNARTGIIQNIVAKQNELDNATDNSQAEQIKAEIEKLYDEKSKAEENIYDYIKDNPTYEDVANDLKGAIDGANQARGKSSTSPNGPGKSPSSPSKPKGDDKTEDKTFLGGVKPSSDLKITINGEEKTVDLSNLDNTSLEDLQDMQTALLENDSFYKEAQTQYDTAKGALDDNIRNISDAIGQVIEADKENNALTEDLKNNATNKIKEINDTKQGIDGKQKEIETNENNLIGFENQLSSLYPPCRANYPEDEEGNGQKQYVAAKAAYDEQLKTIKKNISDTKEAIETAHTELEKLEENLETQCDDLDKIKDEIVECLKQKGLYQEQQTALTSNDKSCKELAQDYTQKSSDLEQQMAQNYANINAVNVAIVKKNQEIADYYTGDLSTADDVTKQMIELVTCATYLAGNKDYYGENVPNVDVENLRNYCEQFGPEGKDWANMSEEELAKEFLAYYSQQINSQKQ